MIITLCCIGVFINKLSSDLQNLTSEVKLPVKGEPSCEIRGKKNITLEIAVTYRESPNDFRVEFGDRYFELDDNERAVVMLHEFIHVQQLGHPLSKWYEKCEVFIHKLQKELNQSIASDDPIVEINHRSVRNMLIEKLFHWLNEIWAELYLREVYPQFFVKRMEFEYRMVQENLEKKYDKYNSGHEENAKYRILVELIRVTYFKKISSNLEITKKFEVIYSKWRDKLTEATTRKEMGDFDKVVDSLTDISRYPDSLIFEERYLEYGTTLTGVKS